MKGKKTTSDWEEDFEDTVYSEDERRSLVEDDELTPIEEAFMMGWEKTYDDMDEEE